MSNTKKLAADHPLSNKAIVDEAMLADVVGGIHIDLTDVAGGLVARAAGVKVTFTAGHVLGIHFANLSVNSPIGGAELNAQVS